MNTAGESIPAHVPPSLVRDFDFFQVAPVDGDLHLGWKRLHDEPPIFFTPHYGGHWVATRAADLEEMHRDHARFSSMDQTIPRQGKPFRMLPVELDPPDHAPFRTLVQPMFSPNRIAGLEATVREITIARIEDFRPRGGCEFVAEFSKYVPVGVFLGIMGLPQQDRLRLLASVEKKQRCSDTEACWEGIREVVAYLEEKVTEREQAPGEDVISLLMQADVGGRRMTRVELLSFCNVLMFAGLDTVVSALGFVARYLALSPEHRRLLRAQPALIPRAVEELLRRYSVTNMARVVREDLDYQGVRMKAGEMVLLPSALYGLDEQRHADPLRVDFAREDSRHISFGMGVHRCLGSHLARMELRVFIEEWLARIPEFRIAPGARVGLMSGQVNTVTELPLQWQP
ncbi:MAG: cytochrome P450 [Gammaproteobacteria bacterium]